MSKLKIEHNDEIINKKAFQVSAELSNGARSCNWVPLAAATIWNYEPRKQQSSFEMLSLHRSDIGILIANLMMRCNQGPHPGCNESRGKGKVISPGGDESNPRNESRGKGKMIWQGDESRGSRNRQDENGVSKKTRHLRLPGR